MNTIKTPKNYRAFLGGVILYIYLWANPTQMYLYFKNIYLLFTTIVLNKTILERIEWTFIPQSSNESDIVPLSYHVFDKKKIISKIEFLAIFLTVKPAWRSSIRRENESIFPIFHNICIYIGRMCAKPKLIQKNCQLKLNAKKFFGWFPQRHMRTWLLQDIVAQGVIL